jgi:hypothetical protein
MLFQYATNISSPTWILAWHDKADNNLLKRTGNELLKKAFLHCRETVGIK